MLSGHRGFIETNIIMEHGVEHRLAALDCEY